MVGLAGEGELVAGLADDRIDDGEREVEGVEDGALLDVEFEEGEGVRGKERGISQEVGVQVEIAEGLGDGDAFGVGTGEVGWGQGADQGSAAQEGELEADALFFGEGYEFYVVREEWRRRRRDRGRATPRMPS